MAKQEPEAKKESTLKSISDYEWDTEERSELISAREGHIRDTMLYATAALWKEMTESWGGVVTHVRTSTDKPTGKVTVCKADSTTRGAVNVRLIGAQNTAEFSFFRPLTKLKLKVPPTRQFNVVPYTEEVLDEQGRQTTVFVFPMAERKSVPRNKKEEAAAKEPAPTQEKSAAAADDTAEEE